MDKNSGNKGSNKLVRIFGEAFLRTMVVLMGMAILGFASFFIIKVIVNSGDKDKTTEQLTVSEDSGESTFDTSSETGDTSTDTTAPVAAISSKDYKIIVLNSTSTKGLAKAWQDKLTPDGFTVANIGNYSPESLVNTKIVVSTDGMGQDLLPYFQGATVEVGTVSGLDIDTTGVDIFIIVGSNDVIQ